MCKSPVCTKALLLFPAKMWQSALIKTREETWPCINKDRANKRTRLRQRQVINRGKETKPGIRQDRKAKYQNKTGHMQTQTTTCYKPILTTNGADISIYIVLFFICFATLWPSDHLHPYHISNNVFHIGTEIT